MDKRGLRENPAERVGKHRRDEPVRPVEVWVFGERRVGLAIPRRRGHSKGQRPIALGQHRHEPLYLDGFVPSRTGEVVRCIRTTLATALVGAVLAAFATAVGADRDKLVILVLDDAAGPRAMG